MDNQMTDIIELAKLAKIDIPKVKTTDPYNIFGDNVGGFSYDKSFIAKLTKFAQLLQQGNTERSEVLRSEAVAWAITDSRKTWLTVNKEDFYKAKMFNWIVTPLYTTPPDTQAKLDKAREALQLGIEALEGEGIYPKTVAKLKQALKDIT